MVNDNYWTLQALKRSVENQNYDQLNLYSSIYLKIQLNKTGMKKKCIQIIDIHTNSWWTLPLQNCTNLTSGTFPADVVGVIGVIQ